MKGTSHLLATPRADSFHEHLEKTTDQLVVHKALGWASLGVPQSQRLLDRIEQLENMDSDKFITLMLARLDVIKALAPHALNDIPTHRARLPTDHNYPRLFVRGRKAFPFWNTILIAPVTLSDCYRVDDKIDRIEECTSRGARTRWQGVAAIGGAYPEPRPPRSVIAMCTFLGIERVIPALKPTLAVWWTVKKTP